MRIGITDPGKKDFKLYEQWLHRGDPGAEILKLAWSDHTSVNFNELDGIVFSGGGDVHPKYYGAEAESARAKRIDLARDEFEFAAIREAVKLKIPLLGVCRGMQIVNVAFGGDLYVDLQSSGYSDHSAIDGKENRHTIRVLANSKLHSIVGLPELTVNSYHHQAVRSMAPALQAVAWSADRVCEAAEWNESGSPFLLLVQWHPERMEDLENPASAELVKRFYSEIKRSVGNTTSVTTSQYKEEGK